MATKALDRLAATKQVQEALLQLYHGTDIYVQKALEEVVSQALRSEEKSSGSWKSLAEALPEPAGNDELAKGLRQLELEMTANTAELRVLKTLAKATLAHVKDTETKVRELLALAQTGHADAIKSRLDELNINIEKIDYNFLAEQLCLVPESDLDNPTLPLTLYVENRKLNEDELALLVANNVHCGEHLPRELRNNRDASMFAYLSIRNLAALTQASFVKSVTSQEGARLQSSYE